MSAKHTPGPWRIAPPGVYTSGVNIDAPTGYVALIGGGISDPVTADARLIAAAPDLLEALERLASYGDVFQYRTGTQNPHEQALAAIAKARGDA